MPGLPSRQYFRARLNCLTLEMSDNSQTRFSLTCISALRGCGHFIWNAKRAAQYELGLTFTQAHFGLVSLLSCRILFPNAIFLKYLGILVGPFSSWTAFLLRTASTLDFLWTVKALRKFLINYVQWLYNIHSVLGVAEMKHFSIFQFLEFLFYLWQKGWWFKYSLRIFYVIICLMVTSE